MPPARPPFLNQRKTDIVNLVLLEIMPKKDKKHDKIISILLELVKKDINTYFDVDKKAPQFKVSPEFPKYNPDIHAFVVRDKGKVDVYQVWRGESTEVAVFDLLRCSMVESVRRLHVITAPQRKPGYSWKRSDVFHLRDALVKVLRSPYNRSLKRMLGGNCVLELTKEDLRNPECIRKRITSWYNTSRVLPEHSTRLKHRRSVRARL